MGCLHRKPHSAVRQLLAYGKDQLPRWVLPLEIPCLILDTPHPLVKWMFAGSQASTKGAPDEEAPLSTRPWRRRNHIDGGMVVFLAEIEC